MKQWIVEFLDGFLLSLVLMAAVVVVVVVVISLFWPLLGLILVFNYGLHFGFYALIYIPWVGLIVWLDN